MDRRSSKKQQELLEYIDNFIKEHGYGPSYREGDDGTGYKSVSTVAVHVNGLLAKGYIRKKDHSARSIEIVTRGDTPVERAAELVWLEGEVKRLLQDERTSEADAMALIATARLLGSDKLAELEALRLKQQKQK